MFRSFMIITANSGIVLFRKSFSKSLAQPRMLAGLVTALCNFSTDALAQPVAYIALDTSALSVVSQPPSAAALRCVAFHDASDGELYGRLVATALLTSFSDEYSERLAGLSLAKTDGAEDLFKAFNSRVRFALQAVVEPLMEALASCRGIKRVLLVRHAREGARHHLPTDVWWGDGGDGEAGMVADLHALLQVADDVLLAKDDRASLVMIGDSVRVERLSAATLVVATAPPATTGSCVEVIDAAAANLQKLFLLMPA